MGRDEKVTNWEQPFAGLTEGRGKSFNAEFAKEARRGRGELGRQVHSFAGRRGSPCLPRVEVLGSVTEDMD